MKRQMKQNEQKEHRGAKEHYVNYYGFLCNLENGFVMKAFIFYAALNVYISRVLYPACTYTGRAALFVTLYFFLYYITHLKFCNKHIFGSLCVSQMDFKSSFK